VEKILIGPGAIGNTSEQYRETLYFRGFHFGSTASLLNVGIGGNMLVNGDFSDGSTGWQPQETAPAEGTASVTAGNEVYYDVIADDGVNWHLRLRQEGLSLNSGKTYRVSFDAWAESNRTFRVNIKSAANGDTLNFDVSLSTNRTTYAREFSVAKPIADDFRLTLYFGAAGDNDVWLDNVSLVEVDAKGDPNWIPQGGTLSLQPESGGTVYLTRYRLPLANYVDAATRMFDVEEFASYAAVEQTVSAGQSSSINTVGLLPGSYDLVLVDNGIVEAVHSFHMAFTSPPVSPHYAVSVEVSGQTTDLSTFYSCRRAEYIKDWGLDGKNYEIKTYGQNRKEPVNAHSWAGISTDAYPITVRVKVLPAAEDDHIDGTPGITLPLMSAHVLPSSYEIPCWLEGTDTIAFTLDRPEKVMVVPNYHDAMSVFTNLAVGHVPLQSFEDTYTASTIPDDFNANVIVDHLSEGFKNPLVFLGRGPELFVSELGLSKTDPGTLVISPGDRPTQAALSAADTVWFEPGGHDLSRLGTSPSYRTYINAGQTYYLEEGAYVAAGFKKNEASGSADCRMVGRGTVSGVNHFWGGGNYDENSLAVEIDVIDGLDFVEREGWGIDGGDLISDISLLGAWHGNCDGLDSLDHCTVLNSFITAHDDNLKLNDHTVAEHLVIHMLGVNAHPIMFKEMWDDVTFANAVVKDVDIIANMKRPVPNHADWGRLEAAAITCLQTRHVSIENAQFSDIRIETPFLARVVSLYNMYSEGGDWPYVPSWLAIDNVNNPASINGITFENITVNAPMLGWRSLLGSGFSHSFSNISFVNLDINGVRVTEANHDDYFEVSGYVFGTDPVDGGSERVDISDPVRNLMFHDSLYSAWENTYALVQGAEGDDDGDGVANLAEFALDGDPNDPFNIGTQPEFQAGAGGFSYVHPVLAKRNPGISYTVETTDNLVSNDWNATGYTLSGTNNLGGDFNAVSNWIPTGAETQQFIRLRIGAE